MAKTQIDVNVAGHRIHRDWENVTVSLRKGDRVVPGVFSRMVFHGRFAQFTFMVEGAIGATFDLAVTVHAPFGRDEANQPTQERIAPFDLFELKQTFTLDRAGFLSTPHHHPLFHVEPSVGTSRAAHFSFTILCDWLDVTSLYLHAHPERVKRDLFSDVAAHTEVVDGKPRFRKEAFGGCELRLLEGGSGAIFAVLIPPCIRPELTGVSLIVFLKERDETFTDLHDVSLLSAGRYLMSFGDGTRLRERSGPPLLPTVEPDPYRGFHRPCGKDPFAPGPMSALTVENFCQCIQYTPHLRIGEQLAASKREAIFVMRIPCGATHVRESDHMAADGRGEASALLDRLRVFGAIGRSTGPRVRLDKLIIAGHGSGATLALHAFDENRDDYDEAWLFDPDHIEKAGKRLDRPANGAKIRLVGGDSHPWLMSKMKQLGDDPPAADVHTIPTRVGDVTVWPRTPAFWARSKAYMSAYASYDYHEGQGVVRWERPVDRLSFAEHARLLAAGPLAPDKRFDTRASALSGIVEIAEPNFEKTATVTLAGLLQNGAWTRATSFTGQCLEELTSQMLAGLRDARASSEQQFFAVAGRIADAATIRRREWSILGWQALSDGAEEKPSDYKSYFELCLRFSGCREGA